ncbi:hypothetical protein RA28_11115 [Ruegeria sp. ANG-S4]|uniref:DUF1636 family protein n=1 Tax=Ruegeria sp. ANG-S4 TaxID=1577904 RepID=UPI0005802038|nr:DUF1636 family protein [Ruegeria sp. ANG-S4]KIC45036.1 hypothetical protein RA28_11115 [Ruegeria sp. ANG-S4]
MPDTADHFILVCATCNGSQSFESLREKLGKNAPPGFAIRSVDCMAGCAHPTTVGFQADGKAQYLFGNITTDEDVMALTEFARQYRRSEDGWTSATDRPRALYTKTLSRMPGIRPEVAQ